MTAENDKGVQPETPPSPVQRETDEGQPILNPADITLPEEDGGEAQIVEQDGDGEDPDGQQPPAAAQPDKKTKNRVPAKQRINQLWHEARQAETVAEQLKRENEELKAQMAGEKTKTQQVNAAALDAHEARWKSERELAKRELIDAKTAADPSKEAEATGRLARAESELQNVAAYKAAQPAPVAKPNGQAQPEPQPQPRQNGNGQQQPQPVEVSPEIQEWVGKNLWAVNDPRNSEFDPEMASFMANQANILEQRMRRQNRANEIGTETYFAEIDRLMREEFPDRFDDTEEEELPQPQPKPQPRQQPANQRRAPAMVRQNGTAPVAAAGQSAGQQPARAQARTVQLSAEERSFAHGMAANGALKYPAGHKMQGKQMSPADAEVAYARQKLNQTGGR